MLRLIPVFSGLLVFLCSSVFADSCLKSFTVSNAHVLDVSERGTFLLSDNRQVRLADILLPYAPRGLPEGKIWPDYQRSVDLLRKAVSGRNIEFLQSEKWPNRYGVWSGHIRVVSGGQALWLQEYLIGQGAARVDRTDSAFACLSLLLEAEKKARAGKRGLWGNDTYRVLSAHDIWPLIRQSGTFQVVEGVVSEVANIRGKYYLNFGKNWRDDFTVKISRHAMRQFRKSNIKPEDYKGKKVLVRGWLLNRNGPLIEVKHPAVIEVPAQ